MSITFIEYAWEDIQLGADSEPAHMKLMLEGDIYIQTHGCSVLRVLGAKKWGGDYQREEHEFWNKTSVV